MTRIVHLIDDTNPGGVTRYLEFLRDDPLMAGLAEHHVQRVSRYGAGAARIEADIIVSHLTVSWRGLPGLMALRGRYANVPLVHVEHSYCEGFVAVNVKRRARFQTLLRTAFALFDHVVAVSHAQAAWMQRTGLVDAQVLTVIPPCVDLSDFADLPPPSGKVRRIGAIGRLHKQKGFDLLIAAFRELKQEDLRLEIHGDGPQRAQLEALAKGDQRILFHGHGKGADAMRDCDVVAMPSRWEPYGLVAQEALAAGRPVLVSGNDGLSDQLCDGIETVPEFSVAGWARALANTVTTAPGAPCRRASEARHRTVSGWQALLRQVRGTKPAGEADASPA
jgi:D-inositol-3-phosphate glycosyltransferase